MSSCARIRLHVQPNAKKTEVVGWHGDSLKIRVHAPPVDGAANQAIIDFLALTFSVQKKAISLISGASSRSKMFELSGVSSEELKNWSESFQR